MVATARVAQTSVLVGDLECVAHVLVSGATASIDEDSFVESWQTGSDESEGDAVRTVRPAITACGEATGVPGPGYGFVQSG